MISVTVFKFDTFLVNYITLLFCQNKNISLSLSLSYSSIIKDINTELEKVKKQTLINLYFSCVYPYLTYCVEV